MHQDAVRCYQYQVGPFWTREQVQLAKAMPPDVARSTLGSALKEALARGSRLAAATGDFTTELA